MKRSTWIVVGVVSTLLLAGAAFVGGRMLSGQNQTSSGGSGSGSFTISGPGGTQSFDIVPAEELPSASPEVSGILVRSEDNTFIVGTGQVRIMMNEGEIGASHDGPEVEVVVTHNTVIYCDATQFEISKIKDGKVQEVVKPGSSDEIEKNYFVRAWGRERGDRLFADVLVYKAP